MGMPFISSVEKSASGIVKKNAYFYCSGIFKFFSHNVILKKPGTEQIPVMVYHISVFYSLIWGIIALSFLEASDEKGVSPF
jgi:hypothetical protein